MANDSFKVRIRRQVKFVREHIVALDIDSRFEANALANAWAVHGRLSQLQQVKLDQLTGQINDHYKERRK